MAGHTRDLAGADAWHPADASLAGSRTGFDRTCSSAIWILTFALPYVLVWYHRKEPVFYLPEQWAPPVVTWLMSASGKGRFLRGEQGSMHRKRDLTDDGDRLRVDHRLVDGLPQGDRHLGGARCGLVSL